MWRQPLISAFLATVPAGAAAGVVVDATAAFLICGAITGPVFAALKAGEKAPSFTTQASLGGQIFTYSLADAVDKYKVLDATLIEVSADNIDILNKFLVSECRNKFPVAADQDQRIMKSYNSVLL